MARKAKVSAEEQARRDATWAQVKARIDAREREWQQHIMQLAFAGLDALEKRRQTVA